MLYTICSPAYLENVGPVHGLADLKNYAIIHNAEPFRDRMRWQEWLGRQGCAGVILPETLILNDYQLVIHACIAGEGIALVVGLHLLIPLRCLPERRGNSAGQTRGGTMLKGVEIKVRPSSAGGLRRPRPTRRSRQSGAGRSGSSPPAKEDIKRLGLTTSKRIERFVRGYRKRIDEIAVAKEIGIEGITDECPRFRGWLEWMKALAENPA